MSSKFQKLYDLFPDGPPTEAIAKLGAEIAISEANNFLGMEAINTESLFRVKMPSGTSLEARRKTRNSWVVSIESPKTTINSVQLILRRTITTDIGSKYDPKTNALIEVGNLGQDMSTIRRVLAEEIYKYDGMPLSSVPEKKRAVMYLVELIEGCDHLAVNKTLESYFKELNDNFKRTGSWRATTTRLLDTSSSLSCDEDEVSALIGFGLMEYYQDFTRRMFEEESNLAKNNGKKVWWYITGGKQSMAKLKSTLDKNSHFIVLNNPESIYMHIQQSESKFVEGVVDKFNCKVKHCDEPEYGKTPCGKKHAQVDAHLKGCNSCKRAQKNKERVNVEPTTDGNSENQKQYQLSPGNGRLRSKGTAPANPPNTSHLKKLEEQEWQARNGEIITIQGPTEGIDPMDFQALADDNRRVANALLAKAAWFEETAEKYEALLRPSTAIREAEEALRLAKESEDTERAKQVAALQRMLVDGPPTE